MNIFILQIIKSVICDALELVDHDDNEDDNNNDNNNTNNYEMMTIPVK